MSECGRVFAVSIVVMLTAFAPASGQTSHAEEMIALKARMEALAPRLLELRRLDSIAGKRHQDSLRLSRRQPVYPKLDSVKLGPFVVLGTTKDLHRTAEARAAAWKIMQPQIEGMERDVDGVALLAGQHADPAPLERRTKGALYQGVSMLDDRRDLWPHAFESAMGVFVTKRLPASLQSWLMGTTLGFQEPRYVYRALALPAAYEIRAEGSRNGECIRRDIQECRSMLALAPQSNPRGDRVVRASFLSYVVRNARPGAVAASSSDTADAVRAIEHIGGRPLDDMLRGWLDEIDATRSTANEDLIRLNLSSIAWFLVCAALAMRSTRWRLG